MLAPTALSYNVGYSGGEGLAEFVGSKCVLTHKKFARKFIITNIVQRTSSFTPSADVEHPELYQSAVGRAYELTDVRTGKRWPSLISAKRLKPYHSRAQFNKQYPLLDNEAASSEAQRVVQPDRTTDVPSESAPAQQKKRIKAVSKMKILRKRCHQGEIQYLTRNSDEQVIWTKLADIDPELVQQYNNKLAEIRRKRQKAARKNFAEGYKAENAIQRK